MKHLLASSSCVAKYCRQGWPDGVSTNEDIRLWATAMLLGRTLRQIPNSQSLIKSISCNHAHRFWWTAPPNSKANEDSLVSPWIYSQIIRLPIFISLNNSTSALHLQLSQLFISISEWDELVQDRNGKLIVHMPMSQLRGKLLFLFMRKGGRVKWISAGSLPSTNPNISVTVMLETPFSPKYNVATRQEEFSINDNACIPKPMKTSHHHQFERANVPEKKDQGNSKV